MSHGSIREAVVSALLAASARRHVDIANIVPETRLGAGGLGVSSLAMLHAFVALEQRFGVVFDDGAVAAARFETVGDLEAFVQRCLPAGHASSAARA